MLKFTRLLLNWFLWITYCNISGYKCLLFFYISFSVFLFFFFSLVPSLPLYPPHPHPHPLPMIVRYTGAFELEKVLLPEFGCLPLKRQVLDSLAVQQLRMSTSTIGGAGWIPGQGTKIPHASRCGQKVRKRKRQVLVGKERLLYSRGQQCGEKADSCPKTNSKDSAQPWKFLKGESFGEKVRAFIFFHCVQNFVLIGWWCS